MATRRSSTWPLLAWFVVLVAVGMAFHRLGAGPLAGPPLSPTSWGSWAAARDPFVAVVAVLRGGVVAITSYLAAVTTIGLIARLSRATRIVTVVDRFTVPFVRHLLRGVVGMTLATVVATSAPVSVSLRSVDDAWAVADGRAIVLQESSSGTATAATGRSKPGVHVDGEPQSSLRPMPRNGGLVLPGRDVVVPSAAPAPAHDAEHEVRPGESFWHIAAAHLEAQAGRTVSDVEIVRYWRKLIDANRGRLADPHNPDLLFPGQVLHIPRPGSHPAASGVSP